MEATRCCDLLDHGGKKELSVRPVETGPHKVGTLAGIEVHQRIARQPHLAFDLPGAEPRDQPGDQVDQRRLAAPRAPDKPEGPARTNLEVEITQDRPRLSTETSRKPGDFEAASSSGTRSGLVRHLD